MDVVLGVLGHVPQEDFRILTLCYRILDFFFTVLTQVNKVASYLQFLREIQNVAVLLEWLTALY